MNKKIFLLIILFSFILAGETYSQAQWWKDKKYKTKQQQQKFDNCKYTFMNISDAFMYSM